MLDFNRLISDRANALDASGIRKVLDLAATMHNPINLSIGQPDFPVPDELKHAATDAINNNLNGYAMTTGVKPLLERCNKHLADDLAWPDALDPSSPISTMVTSGTSAALFLMYQALLDTPDDEIIIPDPYFVAYGPMARFAGGTPVKCDSYPDFRMTAERIEPLINRNTKAVLLNSPANPTGVVLTQAECRDILDLCKARNILLVSDEIYDDFTFDDAREDFPTGRKCPSPCREPDAHNHTLLIRGFGKTFGCTGWRLGYIAGPTPLVNEIKKLSQYSYVCVPTPLQYGVVPALDLDISDIIREYEARRDLVLEKLTPITRVPRPGGAFYAFVEIPEHLNMTGTQVFEAAAQRNLILIPGKEFSDRDTHVRVSMAAPRDRLAQGLDILADILKG